MEYYSQMELAIMDRDIMQKEVTKRVEVRERTKDKLLGSTLEDEIAYYQNRLAMVEERIVRLEEKEDLEKLEELEDLEEQQIESRG